MYKEKFLKGVDSNSIFTVTSVPVDAKGRLLILHGLHDHCGRYEHVSDYFDTRDFATVRYDMRGFGKSEGLSGYINHFDEYINDLNTVVRHYLNDSQLPTYLLAHSMGALISSHHILQYGNPYNGVIFSGGLFKVNEDISPILQKMSGVTSRLFPKLQTIKLDANGLSRDPEVAQKIAGDHLHYMGGVRVRTGSEVMKATARLEDQLEKLDFPMLILHGGDDTVTKHEASELLFKRSKSKDKTLKIYPGAYHELMNETNKEEVLDDIHQWIMEHLKES